MNVDLNEIQLRLRKGVKNLQRRERTKRYSQTEGAKLVRLRQVLKEYGMSVEAYDQLRREQFNRCALCNRHENEITHNSQKLVVDHDHQTGKVRGLLCHKCNVGLGAFKDSPELLESALQYLGVKDSPERLEKAMRDLLRRNRPRLTDEQVAAIRSDVRPLRVIARDFGVSHQHVRQLKLGRYRVLSKAA